MTAVSNAPSHSRFAVPCSYVTVRFDQEPNRDVARARRPLFAPKALGIGAIRLVAKHLPQVMADLANLEARGQMQVASFMAAAAFDSSGLGLMHATGVFFLFSCFCGSSFFLLMHTCQ